MYPGLSLCQLALVRLEGGEIDEAEEDINEALHQAAPSDDADEISPTATTILEAKSYIEAARGNHIQAVTLLGAVDTRMYQSHVSRWADEQTRHDRILAQAREALSPADYEAA